MISTSTKLLDTMAKKSLSLPLFRVTGIMILNWIFVTKFTKNIFEKYIYNPYYAIATNNDYVRSQMKNITERVGDVHNKTILELGPGGNCLLACHLLAAGAKQVILLDNENHIFPTQKDLECYASIFPEAVDANNNLNSERITSIAYGPKGQMPLPNESVDIIYSMAVLEHVTNPRGITAETFRILKPKGQIYHQIDFRDHIYKQSSLFFLSIPPWVFNFLFYKTGMWTNRIRYSKWQRIFQEAGFRILEEWKNKDETVIEIPNKKTSLSEQDIHTTSAAFLLQK